MDRRWGVVAAAVLAFGCKQGIELGQPCELTSDCAEGRVCRFERCRVECRENRDCEDGQLCLTLDDGLGACRLPDQDECATDADCGEALRCRSERCTTGCAQDDECGAGAVCRDDGCEPVPAGVDAGGSGDAGERDAGASDGGLTTDVPAGRVTDGLMILYDFLERGDGATVADVSGSATPVDLTIQTTAAVTWGDGTLRVRESTRAVSSPGAAGLARLVDQVVASNEVTIEAWITPQSATQLPGAGPARIVVMSNDPFSANFLFAQGDVGNGDPYHRYSLRVRTAESDLDGLPGLNSQEGVVRTTSRSHVVARHAADGTSCIFIDGTMSTCTALEPEINSWSPSFVLALANEPSADERPWLGTFHLVAIYARALSDEEIRQNFDVGPGR